MGAAAQEGTRDMTQYIIDLTTLTADQGFVIQGDAAGDYAGNSVSAAGDVNGDGFGDVIVGALFGDDGGDNAGVAYVLFGGGRGFGTSVDGRQVVDLTTLSAAQGFVIQGDAAGDQAGRSVSAAGDVDGDGFDDLIVGAPFGDDVGEAYVLFGGVGDFGTALGDRQVVDLTTLSAAQGFVIRGATYERAGWSVSSAGDVDGDGFDDLIVGAQFGYEWAGNAYVLFGDAGGFGTSVGGRQVVELRTLSAAQGFIIQGDAAGDYAGFSVSSAGDINGDGFDDLIVGAPLGDDGGNYAGEAYVVFGGAGGFGMPVGARQVVNLTTLSAAQGFVIQGDAAGDGAGRSVSSAGDVNGDGFDDLIVGAPFNGDGIDNAGEAYVLFGGVGDFGTALDDRQVVDLTALIAPQGFVIRGAPVGRSVSSAGDVNGDGFDDLIIGAPFSVDNGILSDKAHVLFGGAGGFGTAVGGRQVVDLTTLTATQGFVIRGDATFDQAGSSVSAAGDVDGDGFDDLIVGALRGDDGGYNAGEAYVIFGGNFTGAVARLGGAGDDRIGGVAAGQTMFGAEGDDTVLGNQGDDSINGGSGDDSLNGGADDDTIAGGSGDDSAVGGSGNDSALGGDGNDTLSGRTGDDRLFGEANDDSLAGNAGDDSLDGGQGLDTLFGGAGNDTLQGGGRRDVLVGGEGIDVLTGGSGWDRFVFGLGTSPVATPDTITDFEHGIDKLVLRTGGPDGIFLGAAAFTGTGGIEVRWDAAHHQLQVDVNGDGTLGAGDLAIDGTSLATLTAHDLLFV